MPQKRGLTYPKLYTGTKLIRQDVAAVMSPRIHQDEKPTWIVNRAVQEQIMGNHCRSLAVFDDRHEVEPNFP